MYRYHSGKLPPAMASTRSCRANAPSGDLAASAGMSLSSRFFSPVEESFQLQCAHTRTHLVHVWLYGTERLNVASLHSPDT